MSHKIFVCCYLLRKKKLAFYVFPSHKIIVFILDMFCKPCLLHEWPTGRHDPQLGLIICPHWLSWSILPPLSLAFMVDLLKLSSEQNIFSTPNRCPMCLWLAWLVLTHLHLSAMTLFFIISSDRVSWLLFLTVTYLVLVRSLGCLEFFSNSHLSIFGN